ncbi:MAG: hypothetical protein IK990_05580 [Ruminiclostridium sp.]|nr:hypothetical protein [Ruminiclostridium sp.]
MNSNLVAMLEHKYFKSSKEISMTINNCEVRYIESDSNAIIMIQGDYHKSVDLFFNIDTLFFICFGTYPVIKNLKYNGENIANILNKFSSDHQFDFQPALSADPVSLINQNTIDLLKSVNSTPLYALEYVVSEAYSKVITNHRLTLLLHIIDGFLQFTYEEIKNNRDKLKRTYKKNSNSTYLVKVYYICEKYIFPYLPNCKLLEVLNIKEFDFMETITSTRNWGSHLYEVEGEDKVLFKGKDIIIYFYILYFALRLFMCEKIGLKFKNEDVIGYYNLIHDYILWLGNPNNHNIEDYKSVNYKIKCFISEMQKLSNSEK